MQVEFKVKVRRCHLSHELKSLKPTNAVARKVRVLTTPPIERNLQAILGKGL